MLIFNDQHFYKCIQLTTEQPPPIIIIQLSQSHQKLQNKLNIVSQILNLYYLLL